MSEPQGPKPGDLVVRECPNTDGRPSSGTGAYCVTRYPDVVPLGPEADQLDRFFARGLALARAKPLGVHAWDATGGVFERLGGSAAE